MCMCVNFLLQSRFFAPAIISSLAIQCAIKSLTILQQLWILKWLPNTSSLPSLWLFGKFLVKYMIVCLFASTTAAVVSGSKRITESKWNGAFLYKYYLLYFRFFFFFFCWPVKPITLYFWSHIYSYQMHLCLPSAMRDHSACVVFPHISSCHNYSSVSVALACFFAGSSVELLWRKK